MNAINKKPFPTLLHFLVILGYVFLFTIPFSFLVKTFPKNYKALGSLLAYVFPLILTIWATRKTFDRRGKLNYKPSHFEILPLVIIGAFAFLIVGEFTVFLLPEPSGWFKKLFDALNNQMKTLFDDKISGFLMVAVAAPILEETLFRGVILKALLKKYQPWKAILISALAFGIFHMNPWQFLYATVIGMFLGYMYWKTKSLFYPILIHFILNSTAFIAAQYQDPSKDVTDIITNEMKYGMFMMTSVSLIIIWFGYRYFEKYFSKYKRTIYVATGNKHKLFEINKINKEKLNFLPISELGHQTELRETGTTLKENALQKMRQIAIPYDVDVMADDTGLEVEALQGRPGVYSARYAGENTTYEDNVKKLLEEMKGEENRKAKFRTVIALSDGNKELTFEGEIKGKITNEPRGTNGFGYDSVFMPDGYNITFAEMSDNEKSKISHRARALEKLKKYFRI